MYTILLAFVVMAVWEDFGEAANNCNREAAQLFNIWRNTKPLDTASNAHMRQMLLNYAHSVVEDEWPYMMRDSLKNRTDSLYNNIWL